jgi:hypothetical protein
LQHCLDREPRLYDTKKVYLDKFAKDYKKSNKKYVDELSNKGTSVLDILSSIFIDKDPLLASQSNIPIYYLTHLKIIEQKPSFKFTREKLMKFNKKREENRIKAASDMTEANFDLLEFDRMSQQGTNDASSIKIRVDILYDQLVS